MSEPLCRGSSEVGIVVHFHQAAQRIKPNAVPQRVHRIDVHLGAEQTQPVRGHDEPHLTLGSEQLLQQADGVRRARRARDRHDDREIVRKSHHGIRMPNAGLRMRRSISTKKKKVMLIMPFIVKNAASRRSSLPGATRECSYTRSPAASATPAQYQSPASIANATASSAATATTCITRATGIARSTPSGAGMDRKRSARSNWTSCSA